MSEIKYKHLFEPIQLGGTLFRNRIFASPTGYQDLTNEGYLIPEAFAYYERKAIGGAAAVTIGECMVDTKNGRGGDYHVVLDDPMALHSLCKLTNSVARHGAVASAELQHAGMFANRSLSFFGAESHGHAFGPIECDVDGRHVLPMTEEMIEETIKKYAQAAAFAKQCGFGMVTIHGGHGWLLSQFISPYVNTRTDKWGGADIENRMRMPVAICDAIRKVVGPKFPIEIRISGSECHSGGYDIEEGIKITKCLDGHVDLIHVSAGSHEVPEVFPVTHPSMFLEDGCNVVFAEEIKKHVKTPVATVGALVDPEFMEDIIASGRADVVEIARGLIADPDLPNKVREGREDEVRKCMRCFACFSSLLSNGQFYCAINPKAGRELECKSYIPSAEKKKVLIAGGGIGGMQAAITCAQRGHRVILCEKTGRLGGALRCEEKVPFKRKLDYYLDYQAREVGRLNIDLRLNTEVTKEYAEKVGADVIIAALGARPVVPNIPGIDGANVLSAENAYVQPEKTGEKIAILGGGLVGAELGIYLAQQGKEITVIEMADRLNDGGNFLHMDGLNVQIAKYNLDVKLNTRAEKITNTGVVCQGPDGELTVEADTVIYAVGQRPLREEALALNFCAPRFYQIGDCNVPRNIMAATSEAFAIANDI